MARAEDLFERLSQQGELAIDALIADRQSEELFLDFKRSADNGVGRKLHDTDRQNLAKAISGFGNSEGGVIVWGVDCRDRPTQGDVPVAKVPVQEPKRFVSWLEGAVSGCTVPPHPGVRHLTIETSGSGQGFAVTLVPKSYLAPHQCTKPLQYYMRAGSNFEPVPHGVLAGLFGRPPQPSLFHNWLVEPVHVAPGTSANYTAHFVAVLAIHNRGPGVARDLYLNFQVWPPEGGTKISSSIRRDDWTGENIGGIVVSVVSPDSFKLAPGGHVTPVGFNFDLEPPFSGSLTFKLSFGSAQSAITTLEKKTGAAELERLYRECRNTTLMRGDLTKVFGASLLPDSQLSTD